MSPYYVFSGPLLLVHRLCILSLSKRAQTLGSRTTTPAVVALSNPSRNENPKLVLQIRRLGAHAGRGQGTPRPRHGRPPGARPPFRGVVHTELAPNIGALHVFHGWSALIVVGVALSLLLRRSCHPLCLLTRGHKHQQKQPIY